MTLSSWIIDLTSAAQLQRKSFSQLGKKEAELDELIIENRALLADLLIENDLMEGAGLRYIGRQFHDVDVLFAEVDEEDEPIRLVLVESKLLKNPEAKRRVIGQIIEYAARFQEVVRSEALSNRFPEHRDWLEQNSELLDRQIERGDFLLIICGDSIHANLADIVTRLARRADRQPMSGMQLCLVSMAVYVSPTQHLLVPHVVGLVARAERQLQITVVDQGGEPLKSKVEIVKARHDREGRVKPDRSEEEFLRDVWAAKFGQEAVDDLRAFVERVVKAEIPGLSTSTTSSGRPGIMLRSGVLDTVVPVLRARLNAAGVRDVADSKTWNRDPGIVGARDRFRGALRQIAGASESSSGTVLVPIKSLRTEAPKLIEAVRTLAEELDSA